MNKYKVHCDGSSEGKPDLSYIVRAKTMDDAMLYVRDVLGKQYAVYMIE